MDKDIFVASHCEKLGSIPSVMLSAVVLLFEQLAVPFNSLQGAAFFDVAALLMEAEGTIRHLSTLHTSVRVFVKVRGREWKSKRVKRVKQEDKVEKRGH